MVWPHKAHAHASQTHTCPHTYIHAKLQQAIPRTKVPISATHYSEFRKSHSKHESFCAYFLSSRPMDRQSTHTAMKVISSRKMAFGTRENKLPDPLMTVGDPVSLKIIWADGPLRRTIQNQATTSSNFDQNGINLNPFTKVFIIQGDENGKISYTNMSFLFPVITLDLIFSFYEKNVNNCVFYL